MFRVDLKLIGQAKRPEETVFQVELVYGGPFQVVGVDQEDLDQEDLEQVLMIECPRYLFPFARRGSPTSPRCLGLRHQPSI